MPSSLRGAMLRLTPGPGGAGDGARRGRGRPLLCKLLLLLLESVIALCGELGHRGCPTAPAPWEGSPNHSRVLLPWGAPTASPPRRWGELPALLGARIQEGRCDLHAHPGTSSLRGHQRLLPPRPASLQPAPAGSVPLPLPRQPQGRVTGLGKG